MIRRNPEFKFRKIERAYRYDAPEADPIPLARALLRNGVREVVQVYFDYDIRVAQAFVNMAAQFDSELPIFEGHSFREWREQLEKQGAWPNYPNAVPDLADRLLFPGYSWLGLEPGDRDLQIAARAGRGQPQLYGTGTAYIGWWHTDPTPISLKFNMKTGEAMLQGSIIMHTTGDISEEDYVFAELIHELGEGPYIEDPSGSELQYFTIIVDANFPPAIQGDIRRGTSTGDVIIHGTPYGSNISLYGAAATYPHRYYGWDLAAYAYLDQETWSAADTLVVPPSLWDSSLIYKGDHRLGHWNYPRKFRQTSVALTALERAIIDLLGTAGEMPWWTREEPPLPSDLRLPHEVGPSVIRARFQRALSENTQEYLGISEEQFADEWDE